MKVKFELTKAGKRLHQATYDIEDPDSFAAIWKDVWVKARERSMTKPSSIGALMDAMQETVIDELSGAEIRLTKL
jgi:hypothetical protein